VFEVPPAVGRQVHVAGLVPRVARAATRYHCPMHPSAIAEMPGACPICGMDLVPIRGGSTAPPAAAGGALASAGPAAAGTGAYWCPMHPEVSSDDPGATCEKCGGMRLVPRPPQAGAARPAGVPGLVPIDLTPDRIQLIGMRTAPATREKLSPALRTVGFVTADEGGIALVTARYSGWIEEVLVSQSGTLVKKGQPLARIYSPDLIASQQAYLNAIRWESEGKASSSVIEREARARLQLSGMSEEDIDELASSRKAMRALHARSPIAGYVGKKAAVTGLYVQPGAELFEIANLSTVWVIADVYESEIDRVRVGQKASISVPALPGLTVGGRVSFLYPAVSTGSRTLQVRLGFRNPGLRLRPGMFANVTLDLGAVEAVVVPSEAVVDTGEVQYVFVARQGGRFEPRRVRLGSRGEGKVQVLEGVAEGETVVTTANFLIDSESRLRAAIEGFTGGAPPPGHGAGHPSVPDAHEGREAPAHEAGEHGAGAMTGDEAGPRPGHARQP